jgi:hypothetical protein
MQQYAGQPGTASADFERNMLAELAAHTLAAGGNVQPAYMLPLIAARVTEDSGLRQVLEEFDGVLMHSYSADAAVGTFTRGRLARTEPAALAFYRQHRRGPLVTDAELEQEIKAYLGLDQGLPTIKQYNPGKNGQLPFPVAASAAGGGSSSLGQAAAGRTTSSSQAGGASTTTQQQATLLQRSQKVEGALQTLDQSFQAALTKLEKAGTDPKP